MRARWAVLSLLLLSPGVRADGQLEDPEIALRAGPPPARNGELTLPARSPFLRFDPQRGEGGALAGKTVYVSAGHGWVWDDSLGTWRTQRGNTHDLVEDFVSTETVSQHLIPLLHDMGAYVVPVREADLSPELVIVDDGAATVEAAATTSAAGFATPPLPIPDARNPFAGGGSRLAVAGAEPRSVATWTLAPAADAEAGVFLSWVQDANGAPDAHYVIHHAGGDTHVRVDQRRHGGTWVLIGQYRFAAADPAARRSVELLGDSATPGATLSIDAVRIGGGAGRFDRGMGASGRPAFENGARYQAQWNGAPASVWDYTAEDGNDDVGSRSRFSAWEHEPGEDAVYVAWHTNAPSPARGTSSFAYGPSSFGPLSEFSGVPGSLELMDAIHGELIADLRATWDPAWQDRQQHTAYFGEVNPTHNPEMPATLIEVAFHDTLEDAEALRDPRFRGLAARAIAQGIAKYFAARDGVTAILPPEPVVAVMASFNSSLAVRWERPAPDPAGGYEPTDYVVYLSADGRAFDDGHVTTATQFDGAMFPAARFARVVARNAGGRSRPSAVVGGWAPRQGFPGITVILGSTAIDGTRLFHDDLASRGLGTVDRAYEARIDDGSHAARIGQALELAGYGYSIATAEMARLGTFDGDAVIWLAGEDPAPLTAADRTSIRAYLDGTVSRPGAFVLIGTQAASFLAGEDPTFLAKLGAGVVGDDAETYGVVGVIPGLTDETFRFDDTGLGGYDAEAPDVLAGDLHLLAYDTGGFAAVATNQVWRAAVFGFPIETLPAVADRAHILAVTLAQLGVVPPPPIPPDPDPTDDGGCCDSAGSPAPMLVPLLGVLAALTRRRRVTNMRPS